VAGLAVAAAAAARCLRCHRCHRCPRCPRCPRCLRCRPRPCSANRSLVVVHRRWASSARPTPTDDSWQLQMFGRSAPGRRRSA
jgi:hypothetical protein